MKKIKLGYEIGTGKEIHIKVSHMIVTGVTQLSGKTTTLESLIQRSGLKAIVFRTKIGEKSFVKGTLIPPFFKDKSDWQYVSSLLEATMKEKMRFERAWIIRACKGTTSLLEVKKNIDNFLLNEKLNQLSRNIYETLAAYFELVLPKLQTMTFSNKLELNSGVNIIDLERFSRDSEVQSLIIRSVAEEVLNEFKGVILVIPEAWKFLPQGRGNPCKLAVEEFARQGAANENFIWIDSQDMANTDKTPLKQIYNWILGFQSEINEVKHTLAQIPLPSSKKPKPDEVMSLGTGHFIFATRELTTKVYVQPFWLDNKRAKDVALGKIKVGEIDAPEAIAPFKIAMTKDSAEQPKIDLQETSKRFNKELSEMAEDFFNKIGELQEQINKLYTEIHNLKQAPAEVDEETIIRKIIQKMPIPKVSGGSKEDIILETLSRIPKEKIVLEVLSRVPQGMGGEVYKVDPIEKIKKDFLEEAKNKILSDVNSLTEDSKKTLRFIESQGKSVTNNYVVEKCFHLNGSNSSHRAKISNALKPLIDFLIVEKDSNGNKPRLKTRIKELIGVYEATQEQIDQVYNHIMYEMINVEKE